LRHLTRRARHTGEEFAILKSKKNHKLAIEMWHIIFKFLANEDDTYPKIIFNDFLIFCSLIDINEIPKNEINKMYVDYSSTVWRNSAAIDINDFALIIEQLT